VLDWAAVSRPADEDDGSLLEQATHDLLNPVASILGLGDTIRSRGSQLDDATLRQFGESIARQATRLEAAIRDLVRATRLLRRDPGIAAQSVLLSDLVGELAGDRVRVDIPPDVTIDADPILLGDVIRRLVENALEHSSEVVLVTGGGAWIEVTDKGIGFTEDGLAGAFEPLSAGANAKGERGPGLGLGLYIARRLVQVMGGTLTATSGPGEGSVFRVELPG
jgi:signal transduction histidine kinase